MSLKRLQKNMQLSGLYQDVPVGWFSFSGIKVRRVRHHGLDFEQAVVAWERIGDLIHGEEIEGRTNFRKNPRKSSRKVRLKSVRRFPAGVCVWGGGLVMGLPCACLGNAGQGLSPLGPILSTVHWIRALRVQLRA